MNLKKIIDDISYIYCINATVSGVINKFFIGGKRWQIMHG